MKGWRGALCVVLSSLIANAAMADEESPVDRCRKADQDFDYERAITECGVAAAAPGISREDLVDVYRLLGIANTAMGDSEAAEVWFLKLLVLDPDHQLGDEISPVYREAFGRAQKTFRTQGKIVVKHTPPEVPDEVSGPLALRFDLEDQLDRVRAAKVEVKALGDGAPAPVEVALQLDPALAPPDKGFTGKIVAVGPPGVETFKLSYRLILLDASGSEINLDPPFAPVEREVTLSADQVAGGGGGFPWLWVGVGGAAGLGAVVVLGASAAATAGCVLTGLCVPSEQLPRSQVRVGPSLAE